MVAKTLRSILEGNPPDPAHRVIARELRAKLEEIEAQAALNGGLFFEDALADLPTGTADDTAFVLDDPTPSNNGVYLKGASVWAKTAELPAAFQNGFLGALAVKDTVATADIDEGAVTGARIATGAVTLEKTSSGVQASLARADTAVQPAALTAETDARTAGDAGLASGIAAEAAARIAADAGLAGNITALETRLDELPEEIDLPGLRKVAVDHLVGRPGDAPEHFTLPAGEVVTNADGKAFRTSDSVRIYASPVIAIEPGQRYEVRSAYRRNTAVPDPANDAVVTFVDWLDANKELITEQAINTDTTLQVTTGRRAVSKVVARTAESGIDFVAPGATRYARAWVHTFGTDHTTDAELCSIERLPANLLPGPQGEDGPPGPQGNPGPRGLRGFQGLKGDAGYSLQFALTDGASTDIADRPVSGSIEGATWGLIGLDDSITIYIWSDGQWYNAGAITSAAAANVANTIYVQENGNDALSGGSVANAVATIERALEIAATFDGELTLIDLLGANDNAVTEGHLDMPDNTIIRAVHRAWVFRPAEGFEERNLFRVGSGCFIEGVLAEGFRLDDLDDPTEGFFASFRPGAVIRRVPYVHKVAVRTPPTWGLVPPPLDRENGNPAVGRGGGVVLADGLVCSQYSVFPNIMTWGATPVSPNGIGYCAKNGGLINAVNAVSMWAHRHFYALSGGQIILSACSTQFGDYSLHSDGYRSIVVPTVADVTLVADPTGAASILADQDTFIDDMWDTLVSEGYTTGWTATDEAYTRSDAALFLQCIRWALEYADQTPMVNFAKGLFDTVGEPVFDSGKLAAFIFSFTHLRDLITEVVGATSDGIVTALVDALNDTLTDPVLQKEPSKITAIGHTWTAVMAGVALAKIPPANNAASISDSILETDEGVVVASGQDDQGNALFVGGLTISADTGELGGPPFEQAVRRIATRAAISRSF